MARLLIHVEGRTERDFVNEVLQERLLDTGYLAVGARIVGDARQKLRGGICSWPRARKEIMNHLKQSPDHVVTTMVDFYALPHSWPGRADSVGKQTAEKARCVEDALRKDLTDEMGSRFDSRRFAPFVLMHEFEGLLFSNCAAFAVALNRPYLEANLREIREQFETPEDINDSFDTAPSKRLSALLPEYQKPFRGRLAALEIGIDRIRAECPHFDTWLKHLESLCVI